MENQEKIFKMPGKYKKRKWWQFWKPDNSVELLNEQAKIKRNEALKSLLEMRVSYKEDITWNENTGEMIFNKMINLPYKKDMWFGTPDDKPEIETIKDNMENKEQIEFSEFLEIEKKLEVKHGKILSVESIPKSTKLKKLTVYFGGNDTRTVVTNMVSKVLDNMLDGKATGEGCFFITNLKPVKMMGIESTAMILPAMDNGSEIWSFYAPGTKLF